MNTATRLSTIIILAILLALAISVHFTLTANAQGMSDQMPPVCTMTSTWLDKLFGKCLDIPVGTVVPVNVDVMAYVRAINQATMEFVEAHKGQPNQFVDGNWLNNRAGQIYCNNSTTAHMDVTGKLICQ